MKKLCLRKFVHDLLNGTLVWFDEYDHYDGAQRFFFVLACAPPRRNSSECLNIDEGRVPPCHVVMKGEQTYRPTDQRDSKTINAKVDRLDPRLRTVPFDRPSWYPSLRALLLFTSTQIRLRARGRRAMGNGSSWFHNQKLSGKVCPLFRSEYLVFQ